VRTQDMRVSPVQALKYAQRFQRDCSGEAVALIPEAGGTPAAHRFTTFYNPTHSNSPGAAFISA